MGLKYLVGIIFFEYLFPVVGMLKVEKIATATMTVSLK